MSESEAAGGITPTFIKFQVEKLRLICYLSFWGMCLFAMFVSSNTVAKTLGPCSLNEGDEPTFGMHCSVLMEVFGFNNVSNVCLVLSVFKIIFLRQNETNIFIYCTK